MISLTQLLQAWQQFFHQPEPVATLCVFRVLFGLLLTVNAASLLPYADDFFGPLGILGTKGFAQSYPRPRLSVFRLLPATARTAYGVVIVLLFASAALAAGFCTILCAPLAWLCLVSLHHRNPAVFNAGDSLQRLLLLLLCVAPSGSALSIDCILRGEDSIAMLRDRLFDPWPTRLMQIQISIVYLRSVYWKLRGKHWRDGTAVGYVLQAMNFRRVSAPQMVLVPLVTRTLTYGTLVAESYIPIAIWIRELRYSAILSGWLLHLAFELFLNVHLFGITMCLALVAFIPPQAIAHLLS